MLFSLHISDNFEDINAEYKKFKVNIFRKWCDSSELSIQFEENKLINSIKIILKDQNENPDGSPQYTNVTDDDLVRALIGAKTLSKYSILYQDVCVHFFTVIESISFTSIHKRRFFFKCVAKEIKNRTQYIWDKFIKNINYKYLTTIKEQPETNESILNSIIYIDFLLKYAPDFCSSISSTIFDRLFQILQNDSIKYTPDITYNILSLTSQTLDTYFNYDDNKFYANYVIELFQFFFEKVDSIFYPEININHVLDIKSMAKKLSLLAVIFENYTNLNNEQMNSIFQFLKGVSDQDPEIQFLLTRNLIYQKLTSEEIELETFNSLFSLDQNSSEKVICGQLQNIKLLINRTPEIFDNITRQQITKIISSCLISDKSFVVKSALDLLNSFCLYVSGRLVNEGECIEFDSSQIIRDLDRLDLPLDYMHVIKLMLKKEFIPKLHHSLVSEPVKTLNFLYAALNDDSISGSLIELINCLSDNDQLKVQIEQDLFNLISDEDDKSFAPFIHAKLFPDQFFNHKNIDRLFHFLLCNSSEKVKLSIISCFNKIINADVINRYNLVDKFGRGSSLKFNFIVSDFSRHEIQTEMIKFLCNLHKVDQRLNFISLFEKYLEFFSPFNESTTDEGYFDSSKYLLSLKNISFVSDFLPFIFESYPNIYAKYWQSFFSFTMDFLNMIVNDKGSYVKLSKLLSLTPPKTYFQSKFYKSSFCSLIKTLRVILKNDVDIVRPYFGDVIVTCTNNLKSGIGYLETIHVLSLLNDTLEKMKLYEINLILKDKNIDNLYSIVFKTGSRFISPEISQNVFRILCYLGAQPLYVKEESTYENQLKDDLQSQLMNFDKNRTIDNIYFTICSNSIFRIFEDKNLSHSHIYALEALINILIISKCDLIETYFKKCLYYFNLFLDKSGIYDKNKFVPLLELMIKAAKNTVDSVVETKSYCSSVYVDKDKLEKEKILSVSTQECIFGLVQLLEKLWNYGSYQTVKLLVESFKTGMIPYLGIIIPLVRSIQDEDVTVDILYTIYINCSKNKLNDLEDSNEMYNFDIVDILIQMANKGNYKAVFKIEALIAYIKDIDNYGHSIVDMCTFCLNRIQNPCFESSLRSDDIVNSLNNIKQMIINKKQSLVNEKDPMIGQPRNPSEIRDGYKILFNKHFGDEKRLFVQMFNKVLEDEISPSYINHWLKRLRNFCIKRSLSHIIQKVYPLAKSNKIYCDSIFNCAFHSMIYALKIIKDFDSPRYEQYCDIFPRAILKMLPKCSSDAHAILTNMIEFMDRCGLPIINPSDFKCPMTSVFSNKPSISLRYALVNFEKDIKDAQYDLQHAFLNVGWLDNYQQFSRIFRVPNSNKYQLPIFTGSNEARSHVERANSYFNEYFNENRIDYDVFYTKFTNEINQCHNKVISHIFKTAALIRKYWNNDQESYLREQIMKEIDLGFEALSIEDGPRFSLGSSSVIQSIIYGQQLIELKEMFLSDCKENNYEFRFKDSLSLVSFLPPILLLRIITKGKEKDSLPEKIKLLSLCRKSNRLDLMKNYFDFFNFDENLPVEIEYEMMHYKIANNLIEKEEEFDTLLNHLENAEKHDSYIFKKMILLTKYNKALYYAYSSNSEDKWVKVIEICENLKYPNAINLLGSAALKLFEKATKNSEKVKLLNTAIQNLAKAAVMTNQSRISNLLLINHLLFKYCNYEDTDTQNNNNENNNNNNNSNNNNNNSNNNNSNNNNSNNNNSNNNNSNNNNSNNNNSNNNNSNNNNSNNNNNRVNNGMHANINEIKSFLTDVPYHFYIDIISQIISYIPSLKKGSFKDYMIEFLYELFVHYPEGVIFDYTYSIFSDKRKLSGSNKIVNSPIEEIRDKVKNNKDLDEYFKEGIELTNLFSTVNNNFFSISISFLTKIEPSLKDSVIDRFILEEVDSFCKTLLDPFVANIKQFSELCKSIPSRKFKLPHEREVILDYYQNKEEGNFREMEKNFTDLQSQLHSLRETLSQERKKIEERNSRNGNRTLNNVRNLSREIASLHNETIKIKESIKKHIIEFTKYIKKYSDQLKKQMDKINKPSELFILAPELKQMKDLKLPIFGKNQFNEKTVLIHKFLSKFTSFMSIKNPKKIEIQGDDGHIYSFILKNSEDLRSDQRIMIFFKFMNQVLRNKIKTYLVVPLTYRFGIIQFVKNMTEPIELINSYRKKAEVIDNKSPKTYVNCEINFLLENGQVETVKGRKKISYSKMTSIQKIEMFRGIMETTPKRSTDLRESFWSFNSTSESWLTYVKNYTISCALTSIVGYIIGIGDRHTRNIMIGKKDGYLMHIDFCDTFESNQIRMRNPELVPFRLTRNFVEAFGPCKCDGTFRIYCEEVLGIIRRNREQIMSILNVFIASPVSSDFDQTKLLVSNERDISTNQKNMEFKMERVSKKVNGTDYAIILPKDDEIINRLYGLSKSNENTNNTGNRSDQPLSVEEHVKRLINEATDIYNLATAYSGWVPWI